MPESVTGAPRRLPIGAEPLSSGGVHFRVWAPDHARVTLVLEDGPGAPARHELRPEAGGYFSGSAAGAAPGTRYRFRLGDGDVLYPDPASRFQPAGPHGPSEVVDPRAYAWRDGAWEGPDFAHLVAYELHVGAFTPEGTWRTAARQLPGLAGLGITVVEVMPVADFPGRFGWGYDGVDLFAPTRLYGRPDDFRAFVDEAHAFGIAVVLDVVYNHFGPDGFFLTAFARRYVTDRYANEWGQAVNFDGEDAGPVREFFLANARYWIDEFHLDGLRLDATQQIFDASPCHILACIGDVVRQAAGHRRTWIVAENEPQDVRLLRPRDQDGYALDALWNDDFHHAARVAATGRPEAYMSDYRGTAQELVSAVRYGFLYQGQRYAWQDKPRGTPTLGLPRGAFVNYLQNHDQVANTPGSRRLHQLTSPGRARALAALLLLGPETPLLFMGEEFAASTPFFYFADHEPELAARVRAGRREFVSQFAGSTAPGAELDLPDPDAAATFAASRLDPDERERADHAAALALHRDLLRLRHERPTDGVLDGAVLAPEALCLRWFHGDADHRLLLVNLGPDLVLSSIAEPLVAPPPHHEWRVRWASEHPRYGGSGQPEVVGPAGWRISGHAAVLLCARPLGQGPPRPGEPG